MPTPAVLRADDTPALGPDETELVCPRCARAVSETEGVAICPHDGSPLVRRADLAAAEADPMVGRVLAGRFTILGRVGSGSMGAVYRAVQSPIGREVAIKILRRDRAIDDSSRARFLREARANSLLTSPNTVTVFDFGEGDGGELFLAMELLHGESLGQRIKRLGRLPFDVALDTARQALRSLAEAHAKGIIHRDLKPDNLFYARTQTNHTFEETVKVLDFGIAKMMRADGEPALGVAETQAGMVFGTPRYMSPEQAQGKALDARSDLYSLGVILYHMLTGTPPFPDDDAIVVMARHIKTQPRAMSAVAPNARIPPEVESAVMRLLSKEPDQRPQSAEAATTELTWARENAPWTSGVHASPPAQEGPEGRSPAGDTLSTTVVPSPLRRGRMFFATLVLTAAAVATVALVAASRRSDPPAAAATEPGPATQPPASRPPPTAAQVSPAPPPLPAAAPGAPVMAGPPVEATALPRLNAHPPRPARPHAPSSPKPASASSVGYGYLE